MSSDKYIILEARKRVSLAVAIEKQDKNDTKWYITPISTILCHAALISKSKLYPEELNLDLVR